MIDDDALAAGAPLSPAVRAAAAVLAEAGVPSARRDAELLLAHALRLDLKRLQHAMLLGSGLVPEEYSELVSLRAQRIPLQHLTGVAWFRELELAVGPGVFIPRPETEGVAGWAIDRCRELQAAGVTEPLVVDLGTGSGAIAASVAHEVPGTRVHAVELSPLAHAWADRNTRPHGVVLHLGDLRDALPELNGTVDVLVSNPPYIPSEAVPREPEVADHDPEMALYGGGADGMELPLAAAASAARLLHPGGFFIMEHAEVQAPWLLARLGRESVWEDVRTHQDLNGKDRATSARRAG
ncbi:MULTISPECIES: peptide chain release factor N(5)-glutamine methyltransferase [Arthrobacter]|uniref:Release factor glutamine methyltransferase n=2 Tax=Arthrobacter TaxID=1663 RepID=A0ABU9KQ44_9MICC|nr:peptide chain release factor N(5)-glutamine methyltransferase [Arthrobacter sp. YJM1]MDP5228400.1 peptide chain release factor N(5)-glutamine methyltransferase [Arthrobacter sp. YJM1]